MPAVTWEQAAWYRVSSDKLTDGVLVATLTYEFDIAPHLQRGLMYRRLRLQRRDALHKHDGRATFWWIAIPSLLLFWATVAYGVNSI